MRKKKFQPKLVMAKLTDSNRDSQWKFQKKRFTGTVYQYAVEDRNFRPAHKWNFQVNVPDKFIKGAYIVVRPTQHPQTAYWAGFERQTINFASATLGRYKGKGLVYVKINIADVSGEKNKVGVSKGKRASLPEYIRKFPLRLKKTVASTKGRDGNYQVAIAKRDGIPTLIRLFFALRVWVMYEEFSLPE
jgi:hypothetical protein